MKRRKTALILLFVFTLLFAITPNSNAILALKRSMNKPIIIIITKKRNATNHFCYSLLRLTLIANNLHFDCFDSLETIQHDAIGLGQGL